MVSGAIGVALDITTQAQAEAARRCAELGLSRREREVLALLARADLPTYREIGAVLCVSRETVRTHLRAIARKLGVAERRADVVAAAYARGLLPPAS
uniref:LuxR family transcriptional regulator n=1 Tax=Thermorudis peleae TaxID=1382356 RepID=A0A831TL45_9BACT